VPSREVPRQPSPFRARYGFYRFYRLLILPSSSYDARELPKNDDRRHRQTQHSMVWRFFSPSSQEPIIPTPESIKVTSQDALAMQKHARDLRRRRLMSAINENCALESSALLDCQDSWSLWNRVSLCTAFQKNFIDCLNTQRVCLGDIMLIRLCCCRWDMDGRGILLRTMSVSSGMLMSYIRSKQGYGINQSQRTEG
jgi:hypothetical protein